MESFTSRLELAERYLLCSMPEDAGSASLPLVAEAWAWTLQPPLSPSNLCTSGSGASADDLSTAPDQVDTTRSNGPYSAPSDLASPAAASREDDSVGREVRESETSSRREDMTTDASPQDEIRAAEANCRIPRAHGQPGGSTSDGDMDPYHAVECAGAVWIQALHLLNRDGDIADGLVRVFGHLGHVPEGLLLLWVALAVADGRCAVLRPAFSAALTSARPSVALLADSTPTPSQAQHGTARTVSSSTDDAPSHSGTQARTGAATEAWAGVGTGVGAGAGTGAGACAGDEGEEKGERRVPRRALRRLLEVQVALVLGQGLKDFAAAREALEQAQRDHWVSKCAAQALTRRLDQWERAHEHNRQQSRIKGSKFTSSSGSLGPSGSKGRLANGTPGAARNQQNGASSSGISSTRTGAQNGSHTVDDAEDDYNWSWRPEPGPGIGPGSRAGKSTVNGVSGGWAQEGGVGTGAKAKGSGGNQERRRWHQQQGQGQGRQQAQGQRRNQGSGEGPGRGQRQGERGQSTGDAAAKAHRGDVGAWPLSLALSRVRAALGQQGKVLWGSARAALGRMQGDPGSLVSLALAILCVLTIRFRRQLAGKVHESSKALVKVLMDAWALAFTVNLNPMVAQSAARA